MKLLYTLPALVLGSALFSCKPVPKETTKTKTTDTSGVVIGNPFEYGISNYMIFPVGSNYSPSIFKEPEIAKDWIAANGAGCVGFSANVSVGTYDTYATSGYEYINTNSMFCDIRNILFYDKKTGITKALTADTLHILSFAIHYDFNRPQIFYRVVKQDINNDSMYNELDPVVLFTSSLKGDSLKQLTPDDEQFTQYFYYKDTQTILVKTSMNPDKDTSFLTMAETNFREIHLSTPDMGREIFSKGLRDSMRVN
jgi:hypothetical protein